MDAVLDSDAGGGGDRLECGPGRGWVFKVGRVLVLVPGIV